MWRWLSWLWESGGPERGAPAVVDTPAARLERKIAACRRETCEMCAAGVPLEPSTWADPEEGHYLEVTWADSLGVGVRHRIRRWCAAQWRVEWMRAREGYRG